MRVASNFGYGGFGWRTVVVLVIAAVSRRYLQAPVRAWARSRRARIGGEAA
jgi:hypothetical protein